MSLTISTGKSRFVLKMEDEESENIFREIVMKIVLRNEAEQKYIKKEFIGQKQEDPSVINSPVNMEDSIKTDSGCYKYRGFLHIKCPTCGEIRGFCMKNESDRYFCNKCGSTHLFNEPLIPMSVRCECGSSFNYKTNMSDDEFDVACLHCGAPVAITYNGKKDVFETINFQWQK